jgi:hypothetical protein
MYEEKYDPSGQNTAMIGCRSFTLYHYLVISYVHVSLAQGQTGNKEEVYPFLN